MSVLNYLELRPESHDLMHVTLKKILARLNSPATTPISNDSLDESVNVTVDNDVIDTFITNQSLDAFARLRVSNPSTELEAKHTLDYGSTAWSDLTADGGSVSYNVGGAYALLYLSATSANGQSTHQTLRRAYYQPGKSQLALVTFAIGDYPTSAPADSLAWEIGMGDAQSGVFFGGGNSLTSADGVWFIRRGFGVDTKVTRSNWSVDKLDGTGPSGKTLTVNGAQIFWADCEWLGVGSIRVGFVIDGEFCHCHTFHFANTGSANGPYSATLNLPIRYHAKANNAFDAFGEFWIYCICGSVISEGGVDNIGYPNVIRRSTPLTANAASTVFPLLGWRLNVANIPHARNAIVELDSLSVAGDNALFEILLYRNPTLTGTAPTWVQRGAIEVCETITNATTITGGTPIWGAAVGGTNQSSSFASALAKQYRLGVTADDVCPPLWLAVRRLSGNSTVYYGDVNVSISI